MHSVFVFLDGVCFKRGMLVKIFYKRTCKIKLSFHPLRSRELSVEGGRLNQGNSKERKKQGGNKWKMEKWIICLPFADDLTENLLFTVSTNDPVLHVEA